MTPGSQIIHSTEIQNDFNNEKEVNEAGETTMKIRISLIGKPDENGYQLYIAFHGGSIGDSRFEDEQY